MTEVPGYRIDGVLGRGRAATVYRAVEEASGRTVALKLMAADAEVRERVRRDARLQARVRHPNVLEVWEAGEAADGPFVAMRLVEGPTLRELIDAGGVGARRGAAILAQVRDALAAAAAAGLRHGDLRAANVFVGARDRVWVADFGLAGAVTPDEEALARLAGELGVQGAGAPAAGDAAGLASMPGAAPADAGVGRRDPERGRERDVAGPAAVPAAVPQAVPQGAGGEAAGPAEARAAGRPASRWPGRRTVAGAVAAGALLGVAAGAALGGSGEPVRLRAGAFAVTVPGAWEPAAPPESLRGLGLRGAAARRAPDGGMVVVGVTDAELPALVAGADGPGVPVRVGRLRAVRSTAANATVYAAPAGGAVGTVACVGLGPRCEPVAATLSAPGEAPEPVLPDPAYAARVAEVLAPLDKDLGEHLEAYPKSQRAVRQNQLATRVPGFYARAVAGLRAIDPPRRAARPHARLIAAFEDSRRAWARLRDATAVVDRPAGARAEDALQRAAADAERALDGFRALGYALEF